MGNGQTTSPRITRSDLLLVISKTHIALPDDVRHEYRKLRDLMSKIALTYDASTALATARLAPREATYFAREPHRSRLLRVWQPRMQVLAAQSGEYTFALNERFTADFAENLRLAR